MVAFALFCAVIIVFNLDGARDDGVPGETIAGIVLFIVVPIGCLLEEGYFEWWNRHRAERQHRRIYECLLAEGRITQDVYDRAVGAGR